MKRINWFILLLIMTLILSMTGCSKTEQSAQEPKSPEVSSSGDTSSEPAKQESPKGEELPASYPQEDFPIIPEGIVTSANVFPDGDIDLVISSDKTPALVYEYYKEFMKTAGDKKETITPESYYLKGKKTVWETEITITAAPENKNASIITLKLEKE